jgi:hypothetical protein
MATRYTVIWRQDAELLLDAHTKGAARPSGERSITVGILTAYFRVEPGDRMVFVEAIERLNAN